MKRKCVELIRSAGTASGLDVESTWPTLETLKRASPSLSSKLTVRSFEVMLGTAALYAVATYASRINSLSQIEFGVMGKMARNTALAVTGLEVMYRAEEKLTNTEWYWEDKRKMFGASIGMLGMHAILGTALFRAAFPVLGPFFVVRFFRDAYADAYREV